MERRLRVIRSIPEEGTKRFKAQPHKGPAPSITSPAYPEIITPIKDHPSTLLRSGVGLAMEEANANIGTLLVVDDEAGIREVMTLALQAGGYECIAVANGQ